MFVYLIQFTTDGLEWNLSAKQDSLRSSSFIDLITSFIDIVDTQWEIFIIWPNSYKTKIVFIPKAPTELIIKGYISTYAWRFRSIELLSKKRETIFLGLGRAQRKALKSRFIVTLRIMKNEWFYEGIKGLNQK